MFLASGITRIEKFLPNILRSSRFHSSCNRYSSANLEDEPVEVNPNYENRNPRNLEWNGYQHKRFGWNLHYPSKDFYHRVSFKYTKDHLEGIVEHTSGDKIIGASTHELAFKPHLYSTKDVSSAINLGRVLADRCLKCGISHMDYLKSQNFENSKKEQAFYNSLLENGISFTEPEFVEGRDNSHGLDYDEKDFYNERRNLPFPPELNKAKLQKKFHQKENSKV